MCPRHDVFDLGVPASRPEAGPAASQAVSVAAPPAHARAACKIGACARTGGGGAKDEGSLAEPLPLPPSPYLSRSLSRHLLLVSLFFRFPILYVLFSFPFLSESFSFIFPVSIFFFSPVSCRSLLAPFSQPSETIMLSPTISCTAPNTTLAQCRPHLRH